MKKRLTILTALAFVFAFAAPLLNAHAKEWNDELNEWVFTVTYDFNGGATFEDQETYEKHSVGLAPALSQETLVTCFEYNAELDECHPLNLEPNKELAYVTVNGVRHDLGEGDGYMLDQDTAIVYHWADERYVEDEAGNSITFYNGDEEREFALNIINYSFSMTDEELAAAQMDRASYEAGKTAIIEAIGDQGSVLAYFEFEICDTRPGIDMCVHDGPLDLKLKLPEGMAGYDNYKLIYVETNEDSIATEAAIDLTLEDGYLTGTLAHLSGYVLIGSNNLPKAPDTGIAKKK